MMTSQLRSRSHSRGRHTTSAKKRRSRRVRRRVVWVVVALVALLLLGSTALILVAASKALTVRDTLTSAIPQATALPSKIAAADAEEVMASAKALKSLTSKAVNQTEDLVWNIAEWVPGIGNNFSAIRVAAEVLDDGANYAVTTAPTMNIGAFRPVGGVVDLSAVNTLKKSIDDGSRVFTQAGDDLDDLSSFGLLPQVSEAVTTLRGAVAEVDDMLGTLAPVLEVLPAALGEGGQRTYLLMFQGNSELRASGGNPASLALVTATDGRIEMTAQATSVQFANARPESIVPLDPETEAIYSDIIGRWIPNMTATPDFPTTVNIMRGWWADEGLPAFDDVISVDPIALSYMLEATGPLQLDTGETLTSENAASLLLNEVYFNYGEGNDASAQDAFFAAAAAKVFTSLTNGAGNPVGLMDALSKSTSESRLKIWSSDESITRMIQDTRLSGALPQSNSEATVAGVYFNDTTGAKTDYYADATIESTSSLCEAGGAPSFSQTITFTNNITPDEASRLPYFITGPHYAPGTIATDVVVYTPVGGVIKDWVVEGAQSSTLISKGAHLGRDVVRISVVTTPQTSATIKIQMEGSRDAAMRYGPYDVWTTPMVRETPVSIETIGCG